MMYMIQLVSHYHAPWVKEFKGYFLFLLLTEAPIFTIFCVISRISVFYLCIYVSFSRNLTISPHCLKEHYVNVY